MASGIHNILAEMGFATRSEEIERTLDSFEIDLQTWDGRTAILSPLRTPAHGFRSWRASLASFDGDVAQAFAAYRQQLPAEEFLAQIETATLNMSHTLNTAGGITADSGAFQHEVQAFDRAVRALISLFPRTAAQALRAQELANSVQDDSRNQEIPFTLPPEALTEEPMPTRTDSAPPDLEGYTESASRLSQPSTGGDRYGNFDISGSAIVHLGNYVDLSAGTAQNPAVPPQRTVSGSTYYGDATVAGNARVRAGSTYAGTNTQDPMYQNLNYDAFERNSPIPRSNTSPEGTSAPPQPSFFRRSTGIWPRRNRNEHRPGEAVH